MKTNQSTFVSLSSLHKQKKKEKEMLYATSLPLGAAPLILDQAAAVPPNFYHKVPAAHLNLVLNQFEPVIVVLIQQ